MKTSDSVSQGHRCPACGGRTTIDRKEIGHVRHIRRLPDGTKCRYGLRERDMHQPHNVHEEHPSNSRVMGIAGRGNSTDNHPFDSFSSEGAVCLPLDTIDIGSMRNPNWTTDELILALDLYFRVNPLNTSDTNPEIVSMSELLNKLPIHSDRPDAEKFRNPNGVYMKLCNFLRLDPSYEGEGLRAGSRLDEQVWNEFASDRQRLQEVANAIRNAADSPIREMFQADDLTDDETAPEGRILTRIHLYRERNRELVERKKRSVYKRSGVLVCEICSFDFYRQYGTLGEAFIECHHVKPLSTLRPGEPTKLDDLSLVCANCHRMLHRGSPWPSIAEVQQVVRFRFDIVPIST